ENILKYARRTRIAEPLAAIEQVAEGGAVFAGGDDGERAAVEPARLEYVDDDRVVFTDEQLHVRRVMRELVALTSGHSGNHADDDVDTALSSLRHISPYVFSAAELANDPVCLFQLL